MAKGNRAAVSTREAKEQAAEYFGFTASVYVEGKSGDIYEIPSPGMLDDDQQERWDELQFLLESCDRSDDIVVPEREVDGVVIPARTIQGDLKTPYRINGELLKPTYNARLAIALFGEEGYEKFKADGGSGNQVALEWARMNKEYMERVEADSKSADGSFSGEAVS